jgi:acetoacetate decarboxylase
MSPEEVLANAYSMPLGDSSYPPGPYRFVDREYLIITYRTDREALERVVPKPLEFGEPLVKYEFIRMPNSTGFGDYTESGQVIPVRFGGETGGFVHSTYLDDDPPIAGGREIWGFPRSSPNRRCMPTEIRSWACSISAACASQRRAWATSTARSIRRSRPTRSPSQAFS